MTDMQKEALLFMTQLSEKYNKPIPEELMARYLYIRIISPLIKSGFILEVINAAGGKAYKPSEIIPKHSVAPY
jgi:hypothetical protein